MLTFYSIITQAPLQVYSATWHFNLLESLIRYTFQNQRLQNIWVAGELLEQWNACLQIYKKYYHLVYSVMFSPDRLQVTSSSDNYMVQVWNRQTDEC